MIFLAQEDHHLLIQQDGGGRILLEESEWLQADHQGQTPVTSTRETSEMAFLQLWRRERK